MKINLNQSGMECRQLRWRSGFSLVEVAMATAIAALGIVVILGIIPGGLESIRRAGNTSAESRIVAQIIGEVQVSDWLGGGGGAGGANIPLDPTNMAGLQALTAKKWFFDEQASPLELGSQDVDTSLSYVARVRFSPASGGRVVAPGGTSMTSSAALIIELAAVPLQNFDFNDRDVSGLITAHPVIVTRQF